MKKIWIISVLLLVGVAMTQCTPKVSKAVAETEAKVDFTAESVAANYSAQQLESGKVIFQNSCNRCHKLYEPATRDVVKWNKVLNRMIPKAKLNKDEGDLVRAYLIANSKS